MATREYELAVNVKETGAIYGHVAGNRYKEKSYVLNRLALTMQIT